MSTLQGKSTRVEDRIFTKCIGRTLDRTQDKMEYLMIIFLLSHRNHVVTLHLNRLVYAELTLRAAPFNITIIQVYAPTSGHDDSEVDHFYQKLQETIDQTPKKDILVVQGDWNAKVGKDAQADWG